MSCMLCPVVSRFDAAAAAFKEAHGKMRGKNMIDYTQLGLWYKLYACEVSVIGHGVHSAGAVV